MIWKSPLEENTLYKIYLNSMNTKTHRRKDCQEAYQNYKNSCVDYKPTGESMSPPANFFCVFQTFINATAVVPLLWEPPSSSMSVAPTCLPTRRPSRQAGSSWGRVSQENFWWDFHIIVSWVQQPIPLPPPGDFCSQKPKSLPVENVQQLKITELNEALCIFSSLSRFYSILFCASHQGSICVKLLLWSQSGQLSTTYLYPPVISTGI